MRAGTLSDAIVFRMPQPTYLRALCLAREEVGAAPQVRRLLAAMKARDPFRRTVPSPLPEAACGRRPA